MTNTHRKTTNRTTARIAAVGAFGIGAAIAFPGLAAAQDTDPTGSLAEATGENGSLEGALDTDLDLDFGSLTFNLNLDADADAETPNPGSVELGSLGVSPNTGSALIDGNDANGSLVDTASLTAGSDADADADGELEAETGSLIDTGSLTAGSGAEAGADADGNVTDAGSLDFGSLTAGSGAEVDGGTDANGALDFGSLTAGSGAEVDGDVDVSDPETDTGSLSDSLGGLSSGFLGVDADLEAGADV